ncbi:MAG: DUF167 domain-containing protein [Pseudanabaenaceae cyanobacterium]
MQKRVRVKPNAKQDGLVEGTDGTLIVSLTAPAVDGKANHALIKLLAKTYGVRQQDVVIRSGLTARHKIIEIQTAE